MNKIIWLIIFLSLPIFVWAQNNPLPKKNNAFSYKKLNYAEALGWITMPNAYNICNGFYRELPIPYIANPLVQSQIGNYDITAQHATFSKKGRSTLKGNVRLSQPDQELGAGLVYLYRNKKTGKINRIDAFHHVRVFEPGNLLVAQRGIINVAKNTLEFYNAAYRMVGSSATHRIPVRDPRTQKIIAYRRYQLNYWGHAKTIKKTKPKYYVLKDATYTTCPPIHHAWHLHASTVELDRKNQVGTSWNTVLYVKKIPVFYFPYFSFPISHARKSGFLNPSLSSSSQSGTKIVVPYYFNIAPNVDDTLTPIYFSRRGFMVSNLFRYLTKYSLDDGLFHFTFLPDDKEFKKFKISAQTNPHYSGRQKGLKTLKDDSNSRYSFAWSDNTQYTQNLSSSINLNYVSDDYYIEDFSSQQLNSSENQLLNRAALQYQSIHWDLAGLVQGYQTLHPVDQLPVKNQYARLPELNAIGQYELPVSNLNFTVSLDAVDFDKIKTPDTSELAPVIGQRYSVVPSLEDPIYRPYGFIVPAVKLNLLDYHLQQQGPAPGSPNEAIPTFDLLGGLYFDRHFDVFGHEMIQTLEPEFFYLYVPFHNQNDLPIFDTTTQAFNYNFMFQDNRFSGLDRIGDANQVTAAVTTRFINPDSGVQVGAISIGEVYYFTSRKVTQCSDGGYDLSCTDSSPLDRRDVSPIAGQATFNFNAAWKLTAGLTYDTYEKASRYQNVALTYEPQVNHVVNLDYNLVQNGDKFPGNPDSSNVSTLRQLGVSGAWPVSRHISVLGAYNYAWSGNKTKDHANLYMAGIEYNSCCWAIRFIASRTYLGVDTNAKTKFNNEYYIQVALKGLGALGSDDPTGLLTSHINGYQDNFGNLTS